MLICDGDLLINWNLLDKCVFFCAFCYIKINKNNFSINDLARIRKIINLIINVLEDNIENFSNSNSILESNKELINFLIGSKDNVVSIITKLTNLLVKVIPLEEKINNSDNNIKDDEKLTNEDIEILERYIDKCNFLFNKNNK